MDWKEKHLFLNQTTSELEDLSTNLMGCSSEIFETKFHPVYVVKKLQLYVMLICRLMLEELS